MLAHYRCHGHHFARNLLSAEVRWRKEPAHRLVLLKDVERLTGLSPYELLGRTDTQDLVRLGEGHTREELARIPIALLRTVDSQVGEKQGEKR